MSSELTVESPVSVEVTWLDAWADNDYLDTETLKYLPPAIRKNVGYIVYEDDTVLAMTQGVIDNSFTGRQKADGIQVIPKGMIERIEVIRADLTNTP